MLTEILAEFSVNLDRWRPIMIGAAIEILPYLLTFDVFYALLRIGVGKAEFDILIRKVMIWSTATWLVNFDNGAILMDIARTFQHYGLLLLRAPSVNADHFLGLASTSFAQSLLLLENRGLLSPFRPETLLFLFIVAVASASYFLIGIRLAFTLVKIMVLSRIGPFFLPWGATKATSSITDAYVGTLFAEGVTLMITLGLCGLITDLANSTLLALVSPDQPIVALFNFCGVAVLSAATVFAVPALTRKFETLPLFQAFHG